MSYQALIHRLFKVNLFGGMKLGLSNSLRLQELLGFPDRSFQSVHVAGTNGKGSVVTKIAQGLQSAGYRVGLYTSPHISCFRERIRINGLLIPEKEVEKILTALFTLIDQQEIAATFFELTTALALVYFAQEKVDIAVLETGLGGRLDATNIVSPLLSIITSISLDHTDILGSTLEEIAKEKGGIIKPGIPVIVGPHVPYEIMQQIAFNQKSPLHQVSGSFKTFEEENNTIAAAALKELSKTFSILDKDIESGLKGRQPCRFEVFHTPAPVILDVAHNPDGLTRLFETLRLSYPNKTIRVLFGLSKGKDVMGCLRILTQHAHDFHLVQSTNGRGLPVEELQDLLKSFSVEERRLFLRQTIAANMQLAIEETNRHSQILVVCGSFFIMSAVRQVLNILEPVDEEDLNERNPLIEKGIA
jgi:dihydrofolate synthase / folylpolyglutamate synthase